MIDVFRIRHVSFVGAGLLSLASIVVLVLWGLRPGIEFTGGSLVEVSFATGRPSVPEVEAALRPLNFGNTIVQPVGEDKMVMKLRFLSEEEHQRVLAALEQTFALSVTSSAEVQAPENTIQVVAGEGIEVDASSIISTTSPAQLGVQEQRFETIGPAVSSQLRNRAVFAVIAVTLAIVVYVAYTFRGVSKPVASWKYGVTAIIALTFDLVVTLGILVALGKFTGVEIDIPIVVALLTILGYAVNDTIVVFDRVRENLTKRGTHEFATSVNLGVNQTMARSLITGLGTLFVLAALFFYGGTTIKYFALTLIIGIILGTWSSIFLASPLLIVWHKWKEKV